MTTHSRDRRSPATSTNLVPESAWRKSSYSKQDNSNCVEVAVTYTGHVGIRDSKYKPGPALAVPGAAWYSFLRAVRADRFAQAFAAHE